jgi:hypothetical protein
MPFQAPSPYKTARLPYAHAQNSNKQPMLTAKILFILPSHAKNKNISSIRDSYKKTMDGKPMIGMIIEVIQNKQIGYHTFQLYECDDIYIITSKGRFFL